jgi:hypothetical protein
MVTRVRLIPDAGQTAALFRRFGSSADSIWVCTAWASNRCLVTDVLKQAQTESRISSLVVGKDFSHTDPGFLRTFRLNARVRPLVAGVTFHPKVYVFRHGRRFDALIGSSNLTKGGFSGNIEANVHISGWTSETQFLDLTGYVEAQAGEGVRMSPAELDLYDADCQRVRTQDALAIRSADQAAEREAAAQGAEASYLNVRWKVYLELLRDRDRITQKVFSGTAGKSYLEVITDVQARFKIWRRLSAMPLDVRRDVAGLRAGENRFAWFGTTRSNGYFTQLVKSNPGSLDRALDNIPSKRTASVSHRQFRAYSEQFDLGVRVHGRSPWIACASRLLAMKRPDLFLCVNGENRVSIVKAFQFTDRELHTWEGYWQLHQTLWNLPWHRARRPGIKVDRKIWDARVAMLDAFLYVG